MVDAHQVDRLEGGVIMPRPSMKLAALLLAALVVPVAAQDYPSRIVMRVFSPTASMALTVAVGPV